jgi:hypothetical protein
LNVGQASLAIKPASLLSDKVVIDSINIKDTEVSLETNLAESNLTKILANLEAATAGSDKDPAEPPDKKANRKLQVNDLLVAGGKVRVTLTTYGTQSAVVSLPAIHLKDLGTGPEGITAVELSKVILRAIITEASKQAATVAADFAKGATYISKDLPAPASNTVEKVTKGIGDIFKKK